MIKKLKVISVLGTRPEFIKMSEVIKKFDLFYNQVLINTNQNFEYELNKIFFNDLKLRKPDYTFKEIKNKSAISKISDNFVQFERICNIEIPDAVVVLGDTNSTLVVYVAKRLKIPIFHIEAGNRCFDQRVPEEVNRKVVDHLSDVNFVYSNLAKDYLIKENFNPDRVIKVGSPMKEIYNKNFSKILKSKILEKHKLKKNKYFLISFHREEHLDNKKKLTLFIKLINFLEENYNFNIVISTHYKLRDRLTKSKIFFKSKKIKFLKPFCYTDYCNLMLNSFLVLSDSGTINEEASIMGIKAINLRETHERPEADEEATVPVSGLDISLIHNQILMLNKLNKPKLVDDYNVENFSDKIVKLIGNFVNKINEDVWKKS